MMREIFVLLICCVCFSFATQAQEEAPYLYYYSDVLNAFVIERADGTDSRILGEGLMPPGTNYVRDPGWSPSGKWFAWRSGIEIEPGTNVFLSGWIVSADNTRRLTLFSDKVVFAMKWSPVDDLLAVITRTRDHLVSTFYLVDVETEAIIVSMEMLQADLNNDGLYWWQDGEFLWLPVYGQEGDSLYKITKTGVISDEGEIPSRFSMPLVEYDREEMEISPDGRSFAIFNRNVFIGDFETGQLHKIPNPTIAAYAVTFPYSFQWSADSEWLLSAQSYIHAGGGAGATVAIMVVKRDISIRRELSSYNGFHGWLPDQVLPHLVPGQPESVILQPSITLYDKDPVQGVTWTDSGLVTFASKTLHFWDVESRTETKTVTIPGLRQIYCNDNFSLTCFLALSPDGRFASINHFIVSTESGEIIEELDTHKTSSVRWLDDNHYITNHYNLSHSDDGRQFARITEMGQPEIVDAERETVLSTIPVDIAHNLVWRGDWIWIDTRNEYLLWNTVSETFLPLEEPHPYLSIGTISISPDGQWFAGASIYDHIYIWDLENGKLVSRLNWSGLAIAFSPDSRWLAAGNSQMVTLWDMQKIVAEETP